jgi:hypothetical protein
LRGKEAKREKFRGVNTKVTDRKQEGGRGILTSVGADGRERGEFLLD